MKPVCSTDEYRPFSSYCSHLRFVRRIGGCLNCHLKTSVRLISRWRNDDPQTARKGLVDVAWNSLYGILILLSGAATFAALFGGALRLGPESLPMVLNTRD